MTERHNTAGNLTKIVDIF